MNSLRNEIERVLQQANERLYGPRFCKNCGRIQPVQTFKLEGSDFFKVDPENRMKMNIGFTGTHVCVVCHSTITDG